MILVTLHICFHSVRNCVNCVINSSSHQVRMWSKPVFNGQQESESHFLLYSTNYDDLSFFFLPWKSSTKPLNILEYIWLKYWNGCCSFRSLNLKALHQKPEKEGNMAYLTGTCTDFSSIIQYMFFTFHVRKCRQGTLATLTLTVLT